MITVCAVGKIDDNRIINERIYFDSASLITGIGRSQLLAFAAAG